MLEEKIGQLIDQGTISADVRDHIDRWLKLGRDREALEKMVAEEQWDEINDAFYGDIPFGTGGRRGKMGPGTNRINRFTIMDSAQGIADYLKEQNPDADGFSAVITCDTRNFSQEFAQAVATVFAANGIKVYLYPQFRSTPQLSYSVRHLNTDVGVMISASHNPPSDNGIKVYNSLGGQVVPPMDGQIIEKVTQVKQAQTMDFDEAKSAGKIELVGEEIDKAYLDLLNKQQLYPDHREVSIVYSPLHGVGLTNIHAGLEKIGFKTIRLVDKQTVPDGNFPEVANQKPNPEEPSAMEESLKLGREVGADIALVSDPDADRLGVGVSHDGDWVLLTGPQTGILISYYLYSSLKEQGKLPENGVFVKTLPTTGLLTRIADHFNVRAIDDLLVGFKYIAHEIAKMETDGSGTFLMGTEESLGYMIGDGVRDKDGAMAALAIAEIAAYLKSQGKTLVQGLNEIYTEFGYFSNQAKSFLCPGAAGRSQMEKLMADFRSDPPQKLGPLSVVSMADFLHLKKKDFATGDTSDFEREFTGNMLVFALKGEDQDLSYQFVLRPSGTEPKVKCYLEVSSVPGADLAAMKKKVHQVADQTMAEILGFLESKIDS